MIDALRLQGFELVDPAQAVVVDDIAALRKVRATSAVVAIVVSSDIDECEAALDAGADDFVVVPFVAAQLAARIRAHVRRASGQLHRALHQISVGALNVDLVQKSAELDGEHVPLTPSELAVLEALVRAPGTTITREELLRCIHGTEEVAFDRSIDVVVSRLRSKLERNSRRPTLIETVRGAGYRLLAPDHPVTRFRAVAAH
ncbi:MAG: response regulator transcription factor [Kofleriaceae bacterium]